MTVVIALLKAKPDCVDEVEQRLRDLQRRTRDEPGALEYAVHRRDSGGFLLYERYVDQAACDAHFAAPYVTEFLHETERWLEEAPRVEFGHVLVSFQPV
ncbi:putative quinol monooxygenase [Nonomuraea helvata]|uniref:Quinol monooxygenase n=1 Tax=Nonomuraea helvata TaxID=37484 RepID=A0ABV5RXI0_9ACTN